MKEKIEIRNLQLADFEEGALLMSYSFRDKVPTLKKLSAYDISDFMLAGGLFSEQSLEGHYVAVLEEKIVGILHLDTHEQQKNKIDAPLRAGYIIKKFGMFKFITAGISLACLAHRLEQDEMIVDYVAVHPDYRGHGIGGRLLDFGEDIAKNTEGISRYTLRVIGKNTDAKRLYERKGFIVTQVDRQYIPYLFTGIKVYYSMEKAI